MSRESLTAPLNLRAYMRLRSDRVDPVPFLDLMLLGLFFAMTSNSFLLPPGMPINLPREEAALLASEQVAAVLTVLPSAPGEEEGLVIFGGDIMHQDALKDALKAFLHSNTWENPVLLLKMDSKASLDQLVNISSIARTSGFAAIQIAAEQKDSGEDTLLEQ